MSQGGQSAGPARRRLRAPRGWWELGGEAVSHSLQRMRRDRLVGEGEEEGGEGSTWMMRASEQQKEEDPWCAGQRL